MSDFNHSIRFIIPDIVIAPVSFIVLNLCRVKVNLSVGVANMVLESTIKVSSGLIIIANINMISLI